MHLLRLKDSEIAHLYDVQYAFALRTRSVIYFDAYVLLHCDYVLCVCCNSVLLP